MTTMPALRSRPRSARWLASQASVAQGSSAAPSPAILPPMVRRPAIPTSAATGCRLWRADDHPAVPAILDDQRCRLGMRVIGVAVLDQFERRHGARHRRRHLIARPWRAGRRQIGAEFQRNFAFDAQIDEIRGAQSRRRRMDGACKDRAAAGMRDAHQLLHHLGRRGDLGAGDGAVDRLGQAVISLLRGIGFGDRRRAQVVRQIAIGQAAPARVPHPLRHRGETGGAVHDV